MDRKIIILFLIFLSISNINGQNNVHLKGVRKVSAEINFTLNMIPLEFIKGLVHYQINDKNSIGFKYGLYYHHGIGINYSYYYDLTGNKNFMMLNTIRFEIFYIQKELSTPIHGVKSKSFYYNFQIGHDNLINKKFGINFFVGLGGSINNFFVFPNIGISLKYNI